MSDPQTTAHPSHQQQSHAPQSDEDKRQRKQQVLTHGTSSAVHGISEALVIKDRDLFFLCKPDGDVPADGGHGYGLYYDDCRFLRGYELRLADDLADRLASSAAAGDSMVIELTNPELQTSANEKLPKERVGLSWRRTLDGKALTLSDKLTIENFSVRPAELPIRLRFDARFEDVFQVRGLLDDHPGTLHDPVWQGGKLVFAYDGADGRTRSLSLEFDPAPGHKDGTEVGFDVKLDAQARTELRVKVSAEVEDDRRNGHDHGKSHAEARKHRESPHEVKGSHDAREAGESWTRVKSNSLLLEGIVRRSLEDLQILKSYNAGAAYFAAGVPWFVALFGRDSVITAIETLAYDPGVAEQTLRVLASWQGTRVDDYQEEQPGKILHELRVGELANIGAIPHHPFYGSVDSTPLFCLLLARHAAWTGKLDLFNELRDNLDAALGWIDRFGDSDGDGFIDYQSSTGKGLVNQGWKDSGNAIVNADGSLATPPIALVEVQGYVFAAKREVADLYDRAGEHDRAGQLRKQADELRQRFEQRFWLEDRDTYALALQKDGKPAAVVSSNPGQALWTGIVSQERAARVRDSVMSDPMYSGWGIRTLSEKERRFNPIGYHLGTVWPHDNALIAAGLRRYGFDGASNRVAAGVVEAAMHFSGYRLPEVFAGYGRERFSVPVHYPVACHPQAWAAGAVPYLLTTALGLQPDAFAHELRIVRPTLLDFVNILELDGLRVGDAACDLRFERTANGVAVEVDRVQGDLKVLVEPSPTGGPGGPRDPAGRSKRGRTPGGQQEGRGDEQSGEREAIASAVVFSSANGRDSEQGQGGRR